jgi:uncharacterized protein YyaL (SSP411 family)
MRKIAIFAIVCLFFACKPGNRKMNTPSNHLIGETSPYLLQHAHNPVDWYAWTPEAWEKAKKEDKLVLVSIGYSSCHWCHVMERESFEDSATAELMNKYFVCIKVDREERPDIDQVYMSAVQMMTGSGGWPLNCFCLPDGRPIYGGTYFPNANWNDVLQKLSDFYRDNKAKAESYASELTQGIHESDLIQANKEPAKFHMEDIVKTVQQWKKYFDNLEGGPNRAPKFPLPNNYEFLMYYASVTGTEDVRSHVLLTLDRMAYGGIYDQVGGGFARYSTDSLWKVPHFEKMLYDNAQLVSLYAHAYQWTKKNLYKEVAEETLEFIRREMTSEAGGFYSALDADSEGEEGKYYVWTEAELKKVLGENYVLFSEYYNVNRTGLWEKDHFILLRKKPLEEIAASQGLATQVAASKIQASKAILLRERSRRIRPGLDNKQLTSWNGLMIKGYCDAYDAFGNKEYLNSAIRCAQLFLAKAATAGGGLRHQLPLAVSGKGEGKETPGFLEDYSFMAEALIALYGSTFDEHWLQEAKHLTDYALAHFSDAQGGLFYFTSDQDMPLIARKKEIADNVILSSNSSMAKVLFYLGNYFDDKKYSAHADELLKQVYDSIPSYGSGYSNWSILALHRITPFYEVVIAGADAGMKRNELAGHYLPGKLLAGSRDGKSTLPLLEQRTIPGKTMIYICQEKVCRLPVENVSDALKTLH